jgi:hypothetical protein
MKPIKRPTPPFPSFLNTARPAFNNVRSLGHSPSNAVEPRDTSSNGHLSQNQASQDPTDAIQGGQFQTFRSRKHGNNPLPLSSFFDPRRLAQRHRHKQPKLDPPNYDDLDHFRKKLADNVHGRLRI